MDDSKPVSPYESLVFQNMIVFANNILYYAKKGAAGRLNAEDAAHMKNDMHSLQLAMQLHEEATLASAGGYSGPDHHSGSSLSQPGSSAVTKPPSGQQQHMYPGSVMPPSTSSVLPLNPEAAARVEQFIYTQQKPLSQQRHNSTSGNSTVFPYHSNTNHHNNTKLRDIPMHAGLHDTAKHGTTSAPNSVPSSPPSTPPMHHGLSIVDEDEESSSEPSSPPSESLSQSASSHASTASQLAQVASQLSQTVQIASHIPSAAVVTRSIHPPLTPTLRPPKRGSRPHPDKRQECLCCKTMDTPIWRKGPNGPATLCNACGLKYMRANKSRKKPVTVRKGARKNLGINDSEINGASHKLLVLQSAASSSSSSAASSSLPPLLPLAASAASLSVDKNIINSNNNTHNSFTHPPPSSSPNGVSHNRRNSGHAMHEKFHHHNPHQPLRSMTAYHYPPHSYIQSSRDSPQHHTQQQHQPSSHNMYHNHQRHQYPLTTAASDLVALSRSALSPPDSPDDLDDSRRSSIYSILN
eukprot:TRINITY_DN2655_c0_g2_i1.p1 TRINITY_DN2655_c0_g2~~TRINITY_DN2655_c0_g2_i1.p1  ORF type:complete len:523 (-),score=127.23 TRINITY_DN2655_c0_g2_i1:112-1680(-)